MEIFHAFVCEVVALCADGKTTNIVLDNAPILNRVISDEQSVHFKFLPAYSPFFNAIEEAFSSWKAGIKRQLSLPVTQELLANRPLQLTQVRHRLNI